MGILQGIKAMFGSGDAGQSLVDGAISGIDALVFTDEERSKVNMQFMELKIKAAEATTGSRLARRYLALMVTSTYLFWFNVAGVMVLLGLDPAEVIELLTSLAVGSSFVVIISWYFWSGLNRDGETK